MQYDSWSDGGAGWFWGTQTCRDVHLPRHCRASTGNACPRCTQRTVIASCVVLPMVDNQLVF